MVRSWRTGAIFDGDRKPLRASVGHGFWEPGRGNLLALRINCSSYSGQLFICSKHEHATREVDCKILQLYLGRLPGDPHYKGFTIVH